MLGYAWQKGWLPLGLPALVRAIELNAVQVDKNKAAFDWGRRAAHDLNAVLALLKPATPAADAGQKVVTLHTTGSLEQLVAKREHDLTAYQDAAYAQRYRALVDRVRIAEAALPGHGAQPRLAEAVARNLHKLMAYKDEYEVARLYADPVFVESVRARFEGDWKLRFYLAPPLFAKRDAHGHLVKQAYGPWMLSAFKLLARLKFLRGGAFDIFGKTEERRGERALIVEYEALVGELIAGLNEQNCALAIELANLPDAIRGYGHVKENNLKAVRVKWQILLANWRKPGGTSQRVA
jgi:indolepyruvate ferredoxin oxidoreductase